MLAELGLVGKAPGRYNVHLGGNRMGTRAFRVPVQWAGYGTGNS